MMKRALITGGTNGIGKAISVDLAKNGYEVHIIGRNKERGNKVIEELKELNPMGEHKLFIVDLSLVESNKEFLNKYKEEYKSLDLLILNANIRPNKNSELTKEGLNSIFVTGCISRELFMLELDDLLLNGDMGKIVHIGDARLMQKISEDNIKGNEISGVKSLLASYVGSAYFSYFLNKKGIVKTPSMFVNPGMVDTNVDSKEKTSFWIRIISKKPDIVSKRIVQNIINTKPKDCAMKFYNIDKICSLDNKIAKKESEFESLYNLSLTYK